MKRTKLECKIPKNNYRFFQVQIFSLPVRNYSVERVQNIFIYIKILLTAISNHPSKIFLIVDQMLSILSYVIIGAEQVYSKEFFK